MTRNSHIYYLTIAFLLLCIHGFAQNFGCTDSLAANYNQLATINDGSCVYQNTSVSPISSALLSDTLAETSGMIWWDSGLWTHNDNSDLNLYKLDSATGSITHNAIISGIQNTDWEDISQDSSHIFIGDFGNNSNGNRTDLRIYRVSKFSILLNNPVVDTISFSYSDQINFNPTGSNNTDFDCEAMIVRGDSIYLFTKQWVSKQTSWYVLPKLPGSHIAQVRGTHDVQGLISGATTYPGSQLVVLTGYNQILNPFLYLLYDFPIYDLFGGNKRKVNLSMPFHQVEAITTLNGTRYYITNERFQQPPLINTEQNLHVLDLEPLLSYYLNSLTVSMPEISMQNKLNVFPNPASDEVYVRVTGEHTSNEYRIYDETGVAVARGIIEKGVNILDVSALSKGVYIMESGFLHTRIVIIR